MNDSVTQHKTSDKSTIDVSPAAQIFLKKMLAKQETASSVKLSVNHSGCSGLSYVLDVINAINPDDHVFVFDQQLTFVVDKKSFPYVAGTLIDCVTEGLNKKIVFRNPNAQNTCGCGESFNVD